MSLFEDLKNINILKLTIGNLADLKKRGVSIVIEDGKIAYFESENIFVDCK